MEVHARRLSINRRWITFVDVAISNLRTSSRDFS
jgi:hypothetical protein